jgi:hypothetical protein
VTPPRLKIEAPDERTIEIHGNTDGLRALANDLLYVAATGETSLAGLAAEEEDETLSLTIYLDYEREEEG